MKVKLCIIFIFLKLFIKFCIALLTISVLTYHQIYMKKTTNISN